MNPMSKVFILSVIAENTESRELKILAAQSCFIGMLILMVFAAAGQFILSRIFHVDLYSFKIAGGIILCFIGFKALTKGVFFELDLKTKLREVSIVPLASPMIAGPGTITAAVNFSVEKGLTVALGAILITIILNLIIMLLSEPISKLLLKFNFMGALIRITGLIVMTIGVDMVLTGTTNWIQSLNL
jgi:multiple antibiotic resistance protein